MAAWPATSTPRDPKPAPESPRHDHLVSPRSSTVYLSAPDMIRLVQRKGLSACFAGIAERIEQDFLRWHEFDKCARVPC